MPDLYDDVYSDLYGTPGYAVQIDWDKDGDFSEASEDVTDRVRGPITVMYGRDQATALAPTISGRGEFALDNRSRDYSPRNTLSPIYGKVKPGRPVKISRGVGSDTYTLFHGHTDDQPINPQLDSRTVNLSLVDWLGDFNSHDITTPLYQGIRTGQAINYILDAAGWPADLRDIDPGATLIPWWWENDTDALAALDRVLRSEGPPALLTTGVDGEIVFRDRHHRLTRSGSLTSQGTWTGDPANPPTMGRGFTYDEAWSNIINTASVSVDVRQALAVEDVWTSEASLTLLAGEVRIINASSSDPFLNAVTPVAGTDFTTVAGSVTVRLIGTSGLSVGIELTAVGGTAIISNLKLRANPVRVTHTYQVRVSDAQSIDDYGPRSFPSDMPWCSPHEAEAILRQVVATRSQPLPVLSVPFQCREDDVAALLLTRDLSDRVTVVEPETALDLDFYIEQIQHTIDRSVDHVITFGLEAAPQEVGNAARADVGNADECVAAFGIDDAAFLILTDSTTPGRRVDEGLVAT